MTESLTKMEPTRHELATDGPTGDLLGLQRAAHVRDDFLSARAFFTREMDARWTGYGVGVARMRGARVSACWRRSGTGVVTFHARAAWDWGLVHGSSTRAYKLDIHSLTSTIPNAGRPITHLFERAL